MKKLTAILFFILSYTIASAGNITVKITSPSNNAITDSIIYTSASVQSVYQVAYVIATVNGLNDTLSYDGTTATGSISLSGLPQVASLQLKVSAADIFNTQQNDSVTFLYAKPAAINVVYPEQGANVNNALHIKASVITAGTYTLTVKAQSGTTVNFSKTYTGPVDTVISAPAGIVYFTATDQWNRVANYSISFENNLLLSEIYSAASTISDFNYNKILLASDQIIGLKSKSVTTAAVGGYLTPYGTISTGIPGTYYDWNNNTVYSLGTYTNNPIIQFPLHLAGHYATWVQFSDTDPYNLNLYLRDLSTHTDKLVGSTSGTGLEGAQDNSVDSNGNVAYVNDDVHIAGINDGSPDPEFNPVVDGKYIVFFRNIVDAYSIVLYDGANEFLLSDLTGYTNYINPFQASLYYQTNNKFVAYIKVSNNQLQVWLRDSTGLNTQLTFFNSTSTIESIGFNGDVIFNNNGERYLAKKGVLQPIDLGVANGKLYYRNSAWYVTEGGHLYKLLVNAFITANNGDWNNAATWQGGVVPGANDDVIIQNNITVSSNVSCNSLKVISPASVTVSSGFNLTVRH